jgi:hypothetical protein
MSRTRRICICDAFTDYPPRDALLSGPRPMILSPIGGIMARGGPGTLDETGRARAHRLAEAVHKTANVGTTRPSAVDKDIQCRRLLQERPRAEAKDAGQEIIPFDPEACPAAGWPDLIPSFLRDGVHLENVRKKLAEPIAVSTQHGAEHEEAIANRLARQRRKG